jgi:methionine-gamma-lyase
LQGFDWIEHQLQIDSSIKLIYGETPANPSMTCIDLKKLGALGKKYGVKTVIDNTFCTPYLQQPLLHDIDFVIHSTTKYLNGHGNSIAGAIIGSDSESIEKIWQVMKLAGTNTNPFDAWLLNNGLKTLALRMDAHCNNAMELAEWLNTLQGVIKVNYPGLDSHPDHQIAKSQMKKFGGMLSFELEGGIEKGMDFMNKLKFCTLAPTLGDVDTLVLHPASSSHLKVDRDVRIINGITDGLIRLSVGIEDINDLKSDIYQALNG